AHGADWKGNAEIQKAIAEAQTELKGKGRVLIRASGTEPVLRVMVEARDEHDTIQYAESIADTVKRTIA
ncbi:MAG: phosphoglucosamine mutase, partial [Paraburkholderia sp.]|nr:phosphoglucosamine mutase [Paraburkholderia sp.]